MRTRLTLADDVYEAAKTLADVSGRSLGEVVSELARRGLCPRLEAESGDALPMFEVPPDGELIPGSRAGVLLASEGDD